MLAAPSRPNVVLVMTDDQGYGDLGCHGNPVIRTPHIDALHGRSVRFTNYHVSPTCAPTRSALLTGRYTNATGAWHTIMGRSLLRPGEVTLADCFRASGYRTGIFGKWHLGDNYPCRPQDRGFDEVLIHGGGGVWQTPDYFGNDYFDDTYFHNGKPEKFTGFCTDVWFDNAMKFMDDSRRRGKPFFCYVPTNAPHGPMWSPEDKQARYRGVAKLREPGFYGMIENADDNMGRLVKYLRDRELEENTILIFTTDNGTSSGAQVHNAGMRGNKGSPYEGGHRVPFFVHWPKGGLQGGRDIDTLAAHIDVLPTLRDLCGLKRPAGPELHGRSWKPLLDDKAGAWPDRAVVTDSQRAENLVKWRQAAVMTQQWRLVNPSPDGDPAKLELFDMRKDPGQKQNVAGQHADVVKRLSADYDRWWALVTAKGNEYVRIALGAPEANPVRLTAHDWHGEGSERVWNQRGIRQAPVANGYWAVDVRRAGRYRFELRRWPREVDLPLGAAYRDAEPNREDAEGMAVPVTAARLRIGAAEGAAKPGADDKAAVIELQLKAGPAELQTWLTAADGSERGAYFVYVQRL
jgi:arylsulfatase B